jgi:hypothetical protein
MNEEWEIIRTVLGTRPIHNPRHLVDTMMARNNPVPEGDHALYRFEDEDDRAPDDTDISNMEQKQHDNSATSKGRYVISRFTIIGTLI